MVNIINNVDINITYCIKIIYIIFYSNMYYLLV